MHINLLIKRIYPELVERTKEIESDEELINELIKLGKSKEEIVENFEKYFNCKYESLDNKDIPSEVLALIDFDTLRKINIYPYKYDSDKRVISIASSDLGRKDIGEIEKNGYKIDLAYSFDFEIENAFQRATNKKKTDKISEDLIDDIDPVLWVNEVIEKGIKRGASDIHIENKKEIVSVRYRVDGSLTSDSEFSFSDTAKLKIVNRVKTMAGLDISERRKGQDGRIGDFYSNGLKYDLRISTMNTITGEKINMRIIDKESPVMSFEELGLENKDIDKIKRALNNTNGIIYIGGATGSGKTQTLYTMINHKDSPELNINTLEEPVEKEISTINQVPINEAAGITYSSQLKILLRQDPDVIVVGEIRDRETASLSQNASLAGHLILTTIHANNAFDTLNRLYEMGLESYLVSSTSLLLMSQRLIRPLCSCKKKEVATKEEKRWIESVAKENNIDLSETDYDELYSANGCPKCSGTGYSGRYAIAEVLEVTDEIKDMIYRKEKISDIKKVAIKCQDFMPFNKRGLLDVISGKTSINEAMLKTN